MKTTIYARAVAKAIAFPDQIEIQYQPVDEHGNGLGVHYKDGPYSWAHVKIMFLIDAGYAEECESYFQQGEAALVARPREWNGVWLNSDHIASM